MLDKYIAAGLIRLEHGMPVEDQRALVMDELIASSSIYKSTPLGRMFGKLSIMPYAKVTNALCPEEQGISLTIEKQWPRTELTISRDIEEGPVSFYIKYNKFSEYLYVTQTCKHLDASESASVRWYGRGGQICHRNEWNAAIRMGLAEFNALKRDVLEAFLCK